MGDAASTAFLLAILSPHSAYKLSFLRSGFSPLLSLQSAFNPLLFSHSTFNPLLFPHSTFNPFFSPHSVSNYHFPHSTFKPPCFSHSAFNRLLSPNLAFRSSLLPPIHLQSSPLLLFMSTTLCLLLSAILSGAWAISG